MQLSEAEWKVMNVVWTNQATRPQRARTSSHDRLGGCGGKTVGRLDVAHAVAIQPADRAHRRHRSLDSALGLAADPAGAVVAGAGQVGAPAVIGVAGERH